MSRWWVMALAVVVSGAGVATPAAAQTVSVLSRSAFHLAAEHLSSDDERFVWDADFGGDLDLVDYGRGRLTFLANYEAILGEQFRNFDPNQGNYILAGSLSQRFRSAEAAVVFHHESRHLGDRFKRQAVDWNMLGGRILHTAAVGRGQLETRADLRAAILKSYVDYRWELDSETRGRFPVNTRISVIAGGGLRLLGVNAERARDTQTGFRAEGGLRVQGRGAAVELFVAGERRIDPYPLEFGTAQWLTAGFRLLSR